MLIFLSENNTLVKMNMLWRNFDLEICMFFYVIWFKYLNYDQPKIEDELSGLNIKEILQIKLLKTFFVCSILTFIFKYQVW